MMSNAKSYDFFLITFSRPIQIIHFPLVNTYTFKKVSIALLGKYIDLGKLINEICLRQ